MTSNMDPSLSWIGLFGFRGSQYELSYGHLSIMDRTFGFQGITISTLIWTPLYHGQNFLVSGDHNINSNIDTSLSWTCLFGFRGSQFEI